MSMTALFTEYSIQWFAAGVHRAIHASPTTQGPEGTLYLFLTDSLFHKLAQVASKYHTESGI